jgi:ABC-type phosphate/phosphonate transport system substrate-binding protein
MHSLFAGEKSIPAASNSASAYLIPYRELTEAGINRDTDLKVRFSGSHSVTAALVERSMPESWMKQFSAP